VKWRAHPDPSRSWTIGEWLGNQWPYHLVFVTVCTLCLLVAFHVL
jgi:hypothetical protein